MNEALKPCPFCGTAAGIKIDNVRPDDDSGGYFIACPNCNASTGLRFACGDDPIPLLIEQWNRRAAATATAAQPVDGTALIRMWFDSAGPEGHASAPIETLRRFADKIRAAEPPPGAATPIAPEWISVEERLPAIGEDVLAFRPRSERFPVTTLTRHIPHEGADHWWWDAPRGGQMTPAEFVTHWMPLPAPPTPEGKPSLLPRFLNRS